MARSERQRGHQSQRHRIYEGDAHSYLMTIYKNEGLPTDVRLDAAKAAVRFEKPAKTENTELGNNTRYLVALPNGEVSMDDWKAKYASKLSAGDGTKHHQRR